MRRAEEVQIGWYVIFFQKLIAIISIVACDVNLP